MFAEEILSFICATAYHIKKGLRKQKGTETSNRIHHTVNQRKRWKQREANCIRNMGILWKNLMENPGAECLCPRRNSPVYMPLLFLSFWDECNWSEKKREVVIIPLKQTRNTEAMLCVHVSLCSSGVCVWMCWDNQAYQRRKSFRQTNNKEREGRGQWSRYVNMP